MNLPICSHCEILVMDKNLLKALNTIWHYRCFKCDCCDAVLADLSNSFYFKFGKKLCFQDYMRYYFLNICSLVHLDILLIPFLKCITWYIVPTLFLQFRFCGEEATRLHARINGSDSQRLSRLALVTGEKFKCIFALFGF